MTLDQAFQSARQFHQNGRLAEAENLYRQILAVQPNQAETLHQLGLLVLESRRPRDAAELIHRAIQANPRVAEFYLDLGAAMDQLGLLQEEISAYRTALTLKPNLPVACNNLGIVLFKLGQTDESIASFQKAISLAPVYADAFYNLANVYAHIGRGEKGTMDEAIAHFRRALELRPGYRGAAANLAWAQMQTGELDQSIFSFDAAIASAPTDPALGSKRLLAVMMHPQYDSQAILREARNWEDRYAKSIRRFSEHSNDRNPDRPLRIGYVSSGFKDHVLGRNILPLFRHHDHEKFKIVCYANVNRPDAITQKFRSLCNDWRDIAQLNDDQAAIQIREDKIDILVDLTMHMDDGRLLISARKPAPVQISYAGYPGTTGLSAIDWRLTDPYLDPPGQNDGDYAEQSYRFGDSFWCYDPTAMDLDPNLPIPPLPARRNGFITFGCLNSFCKVNDAAVALWGRVMQNVLSSRLRMIAPLGIARRRVLENLATFGVKPDRIDFLTNLPRPQYLAEWSNIDIGLDTFPYNGHTTSLDALWSGVPVITRIGKTIVGRGGFSQLSNLKLADLAAADDEQFVRIASELAANLDRLSELRSTLRCRMLDSPLTDAQGFARNIETAYRAIWQKWCNAN